MAVQSNIKPDISFKTRMITALRLFILFGVQLIWPFVLPLKPFRIFLSAGVRFLLAGLILYAFARLRIKHHHQNKSIGKPRLSAGGFLLLGGNGCVVWAERFVPSGLAALFIAIVPLWMVLLEWWWHQTKRPSMGVFLGIGIGFLGVWLLMAPDLFHRGAHSIHFGGALLLLLASFSWSIGSVYSRKADLPRPPFLSTAMQMIGGGVLLMLMGFLQGEYAHLHIINFSAKSIFALIYLVIFGSLLGFTAYLWLLKNVGVARTSTYAFVNPVVAIFLGWAFAGEKLDAQTAIAAFFVLVAVIVITIYHKEPEQVKG